jgi:hypothetical protein
LIVLLFSDALRGKGGAWLIEGFEIVNWALGEKLHEVFEKKFN